MRSKLVLILCALLFSVVSLQAQVDSRRGLTLDEAREKDGVFFGVIEGVTPVKWKTFGGVLMLDSKRPAGMFVIFPNDGETMGDLKTRAGKAVAKMFLDDEQKADAVSWQTRSLPLHAGDGHAMMNVYDSDAESIQIAFYERKGKNTTFVYGYFARKSKVSNKKKDSADLMDDNGQGIKNFDKLWKTFPIYR